MRFIRAYIEQIRRLWTALSTSARLALALLVVLVTVTLVWLVGSFAARPQSTPIFAAALSDEQTGQARQLLRRENIEVAVSNGLLVVPSDKRDDAIALLASQSILPTDPVSELERQVNAPSIWMTDPQFKRQGQQLRQDQLSRWISKYPGVRSAQVILEPGTPRSLGTPAISPTASVTITMKPGRVMDRHLVDAVAAQVSGAVGSMRALDVRIVADGRSYRAKDEQAYDSDQLERVAELEHRYETKIQDLLHIDGLLVSVYVEPDPVKTRHTEQTDFQEPVQAPENVVTEESTNSSRRPAGEPGVMPNVATPALPVAGNGGNSTMERGEKSIASRFPSRQTIQDEIGGIVKAISVSVNVPREYLVAAVKQIKGVKDEPSEAELSAEMAKIEALVRTAVKAQAADPAKPDNQVVVKYYVPSMPGRRQWRPAGSDLRGHSPGRRQLWQAGGSGGAGGHGAAHGADVRAVAGAFSAAPGAAPG